jgi:hypothetical protein
MKVRVSPSVISFKDKLKKYWGLEEWEGVNDKDKELLFFGLYLQMDYDVFWRLPKYKKTVFWCGSDILRLIQEPEWQRIVRLYKDVDHWVENEVEAQNLEVIGLKPKVGQSFLGKIDDYPQSYKPQDKVHVYLSGHPNREEEYGFGLACRLASKLPNHVFHLYGAGGMYKDVKDQYPNVICHGWLPEKEMNEQIKKFHCGLRPNEHDGFSEITAKSILMGQYPITRIPYKNIWNYQTEEELVQLLDSIKDIRKPNIEGRQYWQKHLNNFPWLKG